MNFYMFYLVVCTLMAIVTYHNLAQSAERIGKKMNRPAKKRGVMDFLSILVISLVPVINLAFLYVTMFKQGLLEKSTIESIKEEDKLKAIEKENDNEEKE